ncbi:pantetheine-phosphate adenylyltransferase [Chloroflexota bacterium]
MTVAIYPGSFDPITNGHLDIAARASKLFDKLIIAVYDMPDKHLMFTTEERVEFTRRAITDLPNVEVEAYTGLTTEFAKKVNARVMVRGLRMSADFQREVDMSMMNKKLFPGLELICLMATIEYQFLSSSLLKEAAALGGDIDGLVPHHVSEALRKRVRSQM